MKRILLFAIISALAFLLACGGSKTIIPVQPPPPAADFTNSNFSGTYLFTFAGSEGTGETYFTAKMVADGAGALSGTLSLNREENTDGIQSFPQTTGTYTVNKDGRTTISLTTPSASFNNSTGPFTFQITLRATASAFELMPMQSGFSGSGMVTRVADTPPTSLSGDFAFHFEGGALVFGLERGVGHINFGGAGHVSGTLDSSIHGIQNVNQPFTGTYTVNSDGTGTINLTYAQSTGYFAPPKSLRFQAISNDQLLFISADQGVAVVGEARRQSGTFSNASLSGPYILQADGSVYDSNTQYYSGMTAMIGRLSFDGNGNASGLMDLANPTSVTPNVSLAGTATVDSNGRALAAILNGGSTSNLAFYLVSPSEAFFVSIDPYMTVSGRMKTQSLANVTTASFSGKYSLFMAAPVYDGSAISGRIVADGAGTLTGMVDACSMGQTAWGVNMTGTYSLDATGHAAITITGSGGSSSFTGYALSATDLVVLTGDPSPMVSGSVHKQL